MSTNEQTCTEENNSPPQPPQSQSQQPPPHPRVPVAILVRVSTNKQETDRQVYELKAYAASKGYEVVAVCEETITGDSKAADRQGLSDVEDLACKGLIRKCLCHEVSRIARRNSVAHGFIETLETFGVSLYWHSQQIETLLPNGRRNPAAGIMFALLAEMARAERECLTDRINSGLAEARRKGKRLGRPPGSTTSDRDLLRKHAVVVRLLKKGHSVRNTAKLTNRGHTTVQHIRDIWLRRLRPVLPGGVEEGMD